MYRLFRRLARLCLLLAVPLLLAHLASAHDYWLSPQRFFFERGDTLAVHLYVGDDLEVDFEQVYLEGRTTRFDLVTASGTLDLRTATADSTRPVLTHVLDTEGLGLLTMERDVFHHVLSDSAFSHYLVHEGLAEIEAARDARGHRPAERERYARTLKALVQVGPEPTGDLYRRQLGQPLEIVLLQNPYRLRPGDALDAQVFLDGEPLADWPVTALHRDGPHLSEQVARTDADGVARFTLTASGPWLVRLVHLVPCAECADADWESWWSSYAFSVR